MNITFQKLLLVLLRKTRGYIFVSSLEQIAAGLGDFDHETENGKRLIPLSCARILIEFTTSNKVVASTTKEPDSWYYMVFRIQQDPTLIFSEIMAFNTPYYSLRKPYSVSIKMYHKGNLELECLITSSSLFAPLS